MPGTRGLDPQFRPWADWIYNTGKYYDSRLVITSAERSSTKQAKLYQDWIRGRSRIPAAPPGSSLHEFGLALDMARIGIDPIGDPLLEYLGQLWEYYGLRHGGARDPVHFQPRM